MELYALQMEIATVVLAVIGLLAGAFWPKHVNLIRRGLAEGALLVVIASIFLVLPQHHAMFGGTFVLDRFAIFFKQILLGTAALVLLLADAHEPLRKQGSTEFSALVLLATAGMLLLTSVNDFVFLFVALELVTAGAHATYFFRVMPRAQYKGEPPEHLGVAAEMAVRDISEALVDCRFLREPMALPDDQLRLAKYLRYRLALAVLPTLAWARARFVARVVHKDPASWSAAVASLIAWHATATDEAAQWPGRAAQEAQVAAAGGDAGDGDDEGEGGPVPDASAAGPAADDSGSVGTPASTQAMKSKPSGPLG